MSTLESLEGRTLLSNITVTQSSSDVVSILGDTHGDQFKVTVNSNNTLTVAGTNHATSVNGHVWPNNTYTSPVAALGLGISLPGTGNVSDVVALQGQGKTVNTELTSISVTVTGTESLSFTASGIKTASGPGSFTLTDGTSTVAGGALSATVSNSQFSALTIFSTGCCPAYVDLENDNVSGAVAVTEGVDNNDGIVIDSGEDSFSNFGSTTLTQFAGPTMAGCNGDGDFVDVNDANLKDLTILQGGNGAGQSITVGLLSEVEVKNISFGVVATQGNGSGDSILIVSITTSGKPSNAPHGGPDSIITTQGNGNGDSVIVDSSTVWGNIESSQGNGNGDFAGYFGDSAGWTTTSGPIITDFFGLASISQGNGYNDTATLDSSYIETVGVFNSFNNVSISQGASLAFVGCQPGLGDVINVNETNIVSDLTLVQGAGDTTGVGLGNNTVNIATTSPVVVGDATSIDEVGANNGNNSFFLGGASGGPDSGSTDFETGYLDVYTGAAGGAYVQVWNTLVDNGALGIFGPFNINGGGDGNTAVIDNYSSATVTSQF